MLLCPGGLERRVRWTKCICGVQAHLRYPTDMAECRAGGLRDMICVTRLLSCYPQLPRHHPAALMQADAYLSKGQQKH